MLSKSLEIVKDLTAHKPFVLYGVGMSLVVENPDVVQKHNGNYSGRIGGITGVHRFAQSDMPQEPKPMYATMNRVIYIPHDWVYEPVSSGMRCFATVKSGQVSIRRSHGAHLENNNSHVVNELIELGHEVVLDGVLSNINGEDVFTAIDIVWCDGYDTRTAPLELRRSILMQLIGEDNTYLHVIDSFDISHPDRKNKAMHSDGGIIAKKKHSIYRSGVRSFDWVHLGRVHDLENDKALPWKNRLYHLMMTGGMIVDLASRDKKTKIPQHQTKSGMVGTHQHLNKTDDGHSDIVVFAHATEVSASEDQKHSDGRSIRSPATTVYSAGKVITEPETEEKLQEAVLDNDITESHSEPALLAESFSGVDDVVHPLGDIGVTTVQDTSLEMSDPVEPVRDFFQVDHEVQTDDIDRDTEYMVDPSYLRTKEIPEDLEVEPGENVFVEASAVVAVSNLPAALHDGDIALTQSNETDLSFAEDGEKLQPHDSVVFAEGSDTVSSASEGEEEQVYERRNDLPIASETPSANDVNISNGEQAHDVVASFRDETVTATEADVRLISSSGNAGETYSQESEVLREGTRVRTAPRTDTTSTALSAPPADPDLQPVEMHLIPNDPRLMNVDPRLQPIDHRWDPPNERDMDSGLGPGASPRSAQRERDQPVSSVVAPVSVSSAASVDTTRIPMSVDRRNFVTREMRTLSSQLPSRPAVSSTASIRTQILDIRRSIDQTRNHLIADARDGLKELSQSDGARNISPSEREREKQQLKQLTFELDARADQALAELSEVVNYVDDSGNIKPGKEVRVERIFEKVEKNVEFLSSHESFVDEIIHSNTHEPDLDLGRDLDISGMPVVPDMTYSSSSTEM